ncbi:hypothetical protein INT44_005936 [Umbelopsis vinacea]|uniref:Uncharacterized protein n=1 Tax=Umbelopsis vinacea TaxID=44442 RepID=A0A8H7Q0A1_9FUNG|nr:hypothetical protein INT44_005936 [Umbelopsis vinacea]
MTHLDIKLKLANTAATLILVGSHGFSFQDWFLRHPEKFGGRDFILILSVILEVLLVGMTIYQWLPSAPKDAFEAIGFWYLLIALVNSGQALLWYFHLDILAYVGLLWLLASVGFVYHRLRDYPPRNAVDLLFVNAPFSIYAAFTFFATLFQSFWFSEVTRTHPVVHTVIIIIVGFVALHLVDYSQRKDWIYAATTSWILLAAAVFLTGVPHVTSLVVCGILVSAIARATVPDILDRANKRFSRLTDRLSGERAPLLGGN